MATDEERREVARRLREMDYADLQESLICAYLDALGIEGYAGWAGIAQRIADLIDPDLRDESFCKVCGHVIPDGWSECPRCKMVHDAAVELTGIDRDALLELVKELELGAQCAVGRKWSNVECERMAKHLADDYGTIARRIREALGVDDA